MFVSVQHQFEISQAFNRELLKQIFLFFFFLISEMQAFSF